MNYWAVYRFTRGRGPLAPSLSDKSAWRRSAGFQSAGLRSGPILENSYGSSISLLMQTGSLRYSRPEVCATLKGGQYRPNSVAVGLRPWLQRYRP